MGVSAIISNLNGAHFLPKLLDSLRGQEGVDLEIIVVDRLSRDASPTILQGYPEVKVLSEPPETGLVCGYHAGSRVATRDHFFFCNEDMWFGPRCLEFLLRNIDLSRRIGAADPWQWTYDGQTWIHGGTRFVPALWDMNCPYPRRRYDFTVPLKEGDRIPFPCAGAVLVHREMYEDVGGWAQDFFLDLEDVDFFLRAWQRGWTSVAVPEARVYHAVGMSNEQLIQAGVQKPMPQAPAASPPPTGPAQMTVKARRYRSGRSSLVILAIKYFPGPSVLWGYATLLLGLLKALLRLRFGQLREDWAVLSEVRRRSKAAWDFRAHNRAWNRKKPGTRFFREPAFNASTPHPPGR